MHIPSKETWIFALRSGAYTQICGAMRRKLKNGGFGHCALGVLTEEAEAKDSLEVAHLMSTLKLHAFSLYEDAIVRLNDLHHQTFNEIADWIEENMQAWAHDEKDPEKEKQVPQEAPQEVEQEVEEPLTA